MKHITIQYGQPCNLLELSYEDYKALDGFLRGVGVRSRITRSYNGIVTIQAENPYRAYINIAAHGNKDAQFIKSQADEDMKDEEIARYKQ